MIQQKIIRKTQITHQQSIQADQTDQHQVLVQHSTLLIITFYYRLEQLIGIKESPKLV